MSRELILATLRQNQPVFSALPPLPPVEENSSGLTEKFIAMAEGIGSKVYSVPDVLEVPAILLAAFSSAKRMVSILPELVNTSITGFTPEADPHTYADVDVAVFRPSIAVAENAALWLTEDRMGVRALPFITQHIVMVVDRHALVTDMHAAYAQIGAEEYGFGTFIAGPSKTADIEQSLVLGAHGPRSMTIFLH